jgi:hypothetical protein
MIAYIVFWMSAGVQTGKSSSCTSPPLLRTVGRAFAVRCRSEQPWLSTCSSRSARNALSSDVSSAPTRTAAGSVGAAGCEGTAGGAVGGGTTATGATVAGSSGAAAGRVAGGARTGGAAAAGAEIGDASVAVAATAGGVATTGAAAGAGATGGSAPQEPRRQGRGGSQPVPSPEAERRPPRARTAMSRPPLPASILYLFSFFTFFFLLLHFPVSLYNSTYPTPSFPTIL